MYVLQLCLIYLPSSKEEKPHNSAISVRNVSGTQKQGQSSTQTIATLQNMEYIQGKWKNFNYSFVTTGKVQHAQ